MDPNQTAHLTLPALPVVLPEGFAILSPEETGGCGRWGIRHPLSGVFTYYNQYDAYSALLAYVCPPLRTDLTRGRFLTEGMCRTCDSFYPNGPGHFDCRHGAHCACGD